MGTGDASMISTAVFRLCCHPDVGPSAVAFQLNARIKAAARESAQGQSENAEAEGAEDIE